MKFATISFDDGGFFDIEAIDRLKKLGIPATFYVPAAFVQVSLYGGLSIQEIVKLYLPHEVGVHGYTHCDLSKCGSEELRFEVSGARSLMRGIFGDTQKLLCFAQPFNATRGNVPDACRAAGFQFVRRFTARPSEVARPRDPFDIPITARFFGADFGKVDGWIEEAVQGNYPIHIGTHPYELVQRGWWDRMENLLRYLAEKGYVFKTNAEFFKETCK